MGKNKGTAVIRVYGIIKGLPFALAGAKIKIHPAEGEGIEDETGSDGSRIIPLADGRYKASAVFDLGGKTHTHKGECDHFHVCPDETVDVAVRIPLGTGFNVQLSDDDPMGYADFEKFSLRYKKPTFVKVIWPSKQIAVALLAEGASIRSWRKESEIFLITPTNPQQVLLSFAMGKSDMALTPPIAAEGGTIAVPVTPPNVSTVEGDLGVSLRRTSSRMTKDVPLWVAIRKSTDALSFERYLDFMEWLFCGEPSAVGDPGVFYPKARQRALPFSDTDAYRNVKAATEAFVMANCGVVRQNGAQFEPDDEDFVRTQLVVGFSQTLGQIFDSYRLEAAGPGSHVLPYLALIRAKLKDEDIKAADFGDELYQGDPRDWRSGADRCYGVLKQRLENPCLLELIWSYWQEEGMLTQTMNAITRRFQNVRAPLANDPLANTEIDPLRPLNNVLWGYVQDEQHRLSVVRRNYEYDHHYGLRLAGKAVRDIRTADSRSRFLEAFHTLLSVVSAFYKRDDDTTMVADGFPVLNALKEAHLILSQGAHNQFGDLPSTARIEMLMQQWILARPEFREFLPTRIMVAYPEPWMDRVDAMKKLQGWSDTSVLHFRNMAIFGEQVLLSIRYGAWAGVNDPWHAVNWARYWRAEIQGYLHAYRSATGIDLTIDLSTARIDATMPSVHLVRRLEEQRRTA